MEWVVFSVLVFHYLTNFVLPSEPKRLFSRQRRQPHGPFRQPQPVVHTFSRLRVRDIIIDDVGISIEKKREKQKVDWKHEGF